MLSHNGFLQNKKMCLKNKIYKIPLADSKSQTFTTSSKPALTTFPASLRFKKKVIKNMLFKLFKKKQVYEE